MSRRISDSDYVALAEIRYRIRAFLTFSESAAREVGIEPKQHQLLLALRSLDRDDPPTVGRLAERLQIQPNSAVELVRRCVDNGLLKKRAASDRRVVHLAITARGETILEQLSQAHLTELRSMAPALIRAMNRLVQKELV